MNRAFVNLLASDVEKSAQFYERLLGMTRLGDFGWFILLTHPDMPGHEFGILAKDHETVPARVDRTAGGAILTFVIDDVADAHARADALGAEIVAPPQDMPYGQRRLLLRDPDGMIVDVSSPIPN